MYHVIEALQPNSEVEERLKNRSADLVEIIPLNNEMNKMMQSWFYRGKKTEL
jgi:hypothetical protein